VVGASADGGTVPQLTRYGLSVDADLVYRCLSLAGDQTAGTLARSLRIGVHQVRDALAELIDCSAVSALADGRRRLWRARPVATFLPQLQERQAQLDRARRYLQGSP